MIRRPPRSTLFPTRRSSDLTLIALDQDPPAAVEEIFGRIAVLTGADAGAKIDRKSTRLNSSHDQISYAVFCLKKKNEVIPAVRPAPGSSRVCAVRRADVRSE